jgi:hypothetical protein
MFARRLISPILGAVARALSRSQILHLTALAIEDKDDSGGEDAAY